LVGRGVAPICRPVGLLAGELFADGWVVLTAYGVPEGPSRMIFQLWMLDSSIRLTLIPSGGEVVTSPSSWAVLAVKLCNVLYTRALPWKFSSAPSRSAFACRYSMVGLFVDEPVEDVDFGLT
jgi:hypothetical protein